MMNYMKSEHYRLLHKKGLYVTSAIGLALIIAAAVVLSLSLHFDPNFPYATSRFFYSNVVSGGVLIVIIGLLFNSALTGKDTAVIKQSISFGISRSTIFWSKLILTFIYFLLICVIGLALTIVLGESLLASEEQAVKNFLLASFNMIPIVVGGFFVIHVLRMLKVGDVYVIVMLLFFFLLSGDLVRLLFRSISGMDELYHYAPSTLLNENLMSFLAQEVQFEYRPWITGIVISVIFLLIGARKFAKQTID
ncbi:ABC transporter permease [Halalkalibacter sp. APA_J-10(15)]|uniref:ABC transporter permease n=1 Tax=Halalkalibacter sp. APA_J-10(15) TaxID=2933805 RepID=UPI001FF3B71F|nr:ABC transporter permease [Halalkalibacter sp. APA_J-10(15)]MCK0473251.1 ABC transporter permease [Halalkalibacter sp. APA_J-10(15)]